jgi:hypothetical protein
VRLWRNLHNLDDINVFVQTDGDKKIELKPGFYMEHDKDVSVILFLF